MYISKAFNIYTLQKHYYILNRGGLVKYRFQGKDSEHFSLSDYVC